MRVIAARFAENLDALLIRVQGMEIGQLQWQIKPGSNTIGMLLAHIAVTEAYWLSVAACQPSSAELELRVKSIIGIGIEDDGVPMPAGGTHPPRLWGKTADNYSMMIRAARAHTYATARSWSDEDLRVRFQWEGLETSVEWIICHVLEHFIHHSGQVACLDSIWHRELGS